MNNANQVAPAAAQLTSPSTSDPIVAYGRHVPVTPTSFVHAASRCPCEKAVRRMGESVNPDQSGSLQPQRVSCTGRNSSLGGR